jgi:putative ATP-dependent endonuclease of the OLD family
MIIDSIHVRNFRSILNETLYCQNLTAIAGPNGAGKSAFLRALEVFYNPTSKVDEGDFYSSDTSEEIIVGVTFVDLCEEAKKRFGGYLQGDKLTIERVIRYSEGRVSATYHGASLQHDGFQDVRLGLGIKDRGKTAKERYNALRANATYSQIPAWTTIPAADDALQDWESTHPTECIRRRDEGRFFGFDEVGQGYLGRFTRFLHIPAVRDAAEDALEGRGSVLTTLMDMLVRSTLAQNKELQDLRDETQRKYDEIVDPERMEELSGLASVLSRTLGTYVPDASVRLHWLPSEPVRVDLPRADVNLVEDQYATAVHRSGHGLQRAFIMTMLQHLTKAQATPAKEDTEKPISAGTPSQEIPPMQENAGDTETVQGSEAKPEVLPNLVLGIEEPELYQHPNRQRHFAKILLQLAHGITPGVAKRTQVIYATHSPLFIDIDRFDQIRLLRKESNGDKPRQTRAVSTSLERVAKLVWQADGATGEEYTAEKLAHRLRALMTTRVNEGFFAKTVVLVEGEDDCAAIVGTANARSIDLEARGVSVIPVGGKRNMDRPALIFREFGIPVYLVWDSDAGKGEAVGVCQECKKPLEGKHDPAENQRLLRVVGDSPEDWPSRVTPTFCCFKADLETTLKEEMGVTVFEELLAACQEEFGIPRRKHAIKNPAVIAAIVRRARKRGRESTTLNAVVDHIMALAEPAVEQGAAAFA